MALAKKCDFCGDLYDSYNMRNDSAKTNGVAFVNIDNKQQYYTHGPYDCCPTCMQKIRNFTDSLKKEKHHDQI